MQIRVAYELIYDYPQPTPMILTLNIHYTRVSDLVVPDRLITDPSGALHLRNRHRRGIGPAQPRRDEIAEPTTLQAVDESADAALTATHEREKFSDERTTLRAELVFRGDLIDDLFERCLPDVPTRYRSDRRPIVGPWTAACLPKPTQPDLGGRKELPRKANDGK